MIACCCLSLPTFANNKQYQIELLIFSHITPTALSSEQWPIIKNLPVATNDNTALFQPVSPTKFTLQWEAKKLANQKNYAVLYHAAWLASSDDLATPKTLYLQTDGDEPEVNGTMRISLHRYFNVHFQLSLNETTSDLEAISDNPVFAQAPDMFHFLLNQTRRMRSRELNYISHPLFGVLMKITPIKNTADDLKTNTNT